MNRQDNQGLYDTWAAQGTEDGTGDRVTVYGTTKAEALRRAQGRAYGLRDIHCFTVNPLIRDRVVGCRIRLGNFLIGMKGADHEIMSEIIADLMLVEAGSRYAAAPYEAEKEAAE